MRKRINRDNRDNENRDYNKVDYSNYNHNNNYQQNQNNQNNYKKRYNPRQRRESLDDVIDRRNARLEEFFKLCELSVRIIGDNNAPAMVLDEQYILNAYVHNFELRFCDSAFDSNVLYSIKLTEKPNFDKNRVLSCINDYEKRRVYKLSLRDSNPTLYLSGYNFLDKKQKVGRYPVFSSYRPKVYFNEEKASSIVAELLNDGYNLDIC